MSANPAADVKAARDRVGALSLLANARRHRHALVRTGDVLARVHGSGAVGRFNQRVAVFITAKVGTVWCAYLFTVIGAMGIFGALTNSVTLVLLIGAVSGYFLQLVLLPIIIVGQNVQAAASDARAEADHLTLEALHVINAQQLEILEKLAGRA